MTTPDRGDWIQTYTGLQFFPKSPRPQDVDIHDIAHALGNLCRFGGHSHAFYSVAEHCVLMSRMVLAHDAPWALMHDAAEAYLVDLPRPIKYMLPQYQEWEGRLLRVIANKFIYADRFGILDDVAILPPAIREADARMLMTERRVLMPNTIHRWDAGLEDLEPYPVFIERWSPERAGQEFLKRFNEIIGG